jgi:hypothetical protein
MRVMAPAPRTATLHDKWSTISCAAVLNLHYLLDYPIFVIPKGRVGERDSSGYAQYRDADNKVYKTVSF